MRTPGSCPLPSQCFPLPRLSPEIPNHALKIQASFCTTAHQGGWGTALVNAGFTLARLEHGWERTWSACLIATAPLSAPAPAKSHTYSSIPNVEGRLEAFWLYPHPLGVGTGQVLLMEGSGPPWWHGFPSIMVHREWDAEDTWDRFTPVMELWNG